LPDRSPALPMLAMRRFVVGSAPAHLKTLLETMNVCWKNHPENA
jgi:hypothetical protein